MIRVAVAGTRGRMGTVAREALLRSGEYVGGLSRQADPAKNEFDSIDGLLSCKPDVLLDLTVQPSSYGIASAAVERGVPTVVGASGWTDAQRSAIGTLALERGVGVLIVPNFSLGAALLVRFAQEAARFFPSAEIVEMHHPDKKDRPSGTALETALRMERACGTRPAIHSVRLPGLVAHQEVLFGGVGELLTLRHDSFSRESFVGGIYAAVRAVPNMRGLTVGLDTVLEAAG